MNVIRRIVMVGVVCAFLVPALASAEDESPDYGRFGLYVGVNAAVGYPLFEGNIQAIDPTAKINYGWGLNTRVGVRLLSTTPSGRAASAVLIPRTGHTTRRSAGSRAARGTRARVRSERRHPV